MFSEILLDHFQNPRNPGELPGATARVEVSNPVCGDVLRLAVIVECAIVREARFLFRGCTASIACASLLTEKMKGRGSGWPAFRLFPRGTTGRGWLTGDPAKNLGKLITTKTSFLLARIGGMTARNKSRVPMTKSRRRCSLES